jgi:DegV family protein with EDD domain
VPGPVAVVTDSACDLPPAAAAEAGVTIVPLLVTLGSQSFLDGVELTADEFWRRVEEGTVPTTASPSIGAFREAYRQAADRGASGVTSVHLSGALSRTADTARQAARDAPLPVAVVDTGSVSAAQGLVALAAAGVAAAGASREDVTRAAHGAVARLRLAAVVDSADFLARGGRVGPASTAVTGSLRIRPVLTIRQGRPVLHSRARTRSRAIDDAIEVVAGPAEAAAVFHSGTPEADDVAARLAGITGVEPLVGPVGPVTGTHLGPRALGLAAIGRADGASP